jgi:pantoate kinase
MVSALAYAPGHLTGLFQICDQSSDPIMKGSRGSGVSIDLGVYTKVECHPAIETGWTIRINGVQTNEAIVSENVLNKFHCYLPSPMHVSVEHTIETPITAGFGSSGGGALSLSLALNKAAETGLTRLEAARIAHSAEIECRTGLGSVFAAERGGFGVLTEPGSPGIGQAINYPRDTTLRVVYLHYGPMLTKEALSNMDIRRKINELGGEFVNELRRKPTVDRFMLFSRRFTEHVGLATPRLKNLINAMDKTGYTFTMAMFGEVAFSVMKERQAEEAAVNLETIAPGYEAVVVSINEDGAKLVD